MFEMKRYFTIRDIELSKQQGCDVFLDKWEESPTKDIKEALVTARKELEEFYGRIGFEIVYLPEDQQMERNGQRKLL